MPTSETLNRMHFDFTRHDFNNHKCDGCNEIEVFSNRTKSTITIFYNDHYVIIHPKIDAYQIKNYEDGKQDE